MAITSIKTGSSFTNLIKYNDFLGPNAAYIPTDFESIATVTANGSSSALTFTSIPSTYKHLQIRGIANDAFRSNLRMTFNSDTGANYSFHMLYGNGSAATVAAGSSANYIDYVGKAESTTSVYGASIIDIHDYASTTKNKTSRTFFGYDFNGGGWSALSSGLWMSTSAITSITITDPNGNYTSGSVFSLYGIKGA
jgi:hypothetical protein